jgi:hypothetical protein
MLVIPGAGILVVQRWTVSKAKRAPATPKETSLFGICNFNCIEGSRQKDVKMYAKAEAFIFQ